MHYHVRQIIPKAFRRVMRAPVLGIGLRILFSPFTMTYLILRSLVIGIIHAPRAPMATYRSLVRGRNWLLAKIEYAQAESQKWRTTFSILKSPYSLLRTMGFSPQMAVSFLVAGSAVGGGVVVNETILQEKSFARGDSGIYSAPSDVPTMWSETFNTLRIDLGSVPVKEITISDVSVGDVYTGSDLPSNATTAIDIGGTDSASTFLEVGVFTFERNRCDTLLLQSISAHTLIIEENVSDGQSISPGAGTARPRRIGGGHHMADAMVTKSGTYDRIWIQAPTSSVNGKVDELTISNAFTRGGECFLHDIKAGTFIVRQNVIGEGDGLADKDFTIGTSVTASVIQNTDNVEVVVAKPATVTADS
jgi:hypothetical protein